AGQEEANEEIVLRMRMDCLDPEHGNLGEDVPSDTMRIVGNIGEGRQRKPLDSDAIPLRLFWIRGPTASV
ncbi:MAG: hypothetical protein ACLP7Q_20770, partial [Isosphaeraceae bacterium]